MKTGKRKKTPKYVEKQCWETMMMVDDELIDRVDIWHFYLFNLNIRSKVPKVAGKTLKYLHA